MQDLRWHGARCATLRSFGRRRSLAGPRHGCQHRALQRGRRAAAACAARPSARPAGDGVVRIRARSRLQGRRRDELRHVDPHARAGPGDDVVRGRVRLGPGSRRSSDGGEMQPADALFASGGFFTTLGVPALLGRTFTTVDDQKGGGPEGAVAVISYGVWQRRFNGAAGVIGTAAARRRRPLHGDRRHAPGLLRDRGRTAVRRRPAPRRGADRARLACLAAQSFGADVDRHVQARARTIGGHGDGGAARDAGGHSRPLRRFSAARSRRC